LIICRKPVPMDRSSHECCRCGAKKGIFAIWEGAQQGSWLWVKSVNLSAREWAEWDLRRHQWGPLDLARWTKSSDDEVGMYCDSCWKEWARYVKLGSKYALSKSCEQLANQQDAQYLQSKERSGNPFQCTLCKTFLNTGTLEAHLQRHCNVHHSAPNVPQPQDGEADQGPAGADQPIHESCWEFLASLASSRGDPEDWQPMRRDMQHLLEQRWVAGWHGENGTDEFQVQTNGSLYSITCSSMVQVNLRTGRVRAIRRGSRPNQEMVQQILAAKDMTIQTLQSEIQACSADLEELQDENIKLKLSHLDHEAQMIIQEAWRKGHQLQVPFYTPLPVQDTMCRTLEALLRSACPQDHYDSCDAMRNIRVSQVDQIRNVDLWKIYDFRKEQVRKQLAGDQIGSLSHAYGLPEAACPWARTDGAINEILVLHGTLPENLDKIAKYGFDGRLARKGMYGQGVYFTDQSCKSVQYSGALVQAVGCVIVARLVLGNPFFATRPLREVKVEPLDPLDPARGRCNSVIVNPGIDRGDGTAQVHREFVIFDGHLAYPELIVHFEV